MRLLGGELQSSGFCYVAHVASIAVSQMFCYLICAQHVHLSFKPQEVAHGAMQTQVKIHEESVTFLVEMCEIIGIIIKEGAVAVGTYNGIPMLATPVAVFAYANIAHGCAAAVVHYGNVEA